jgi:hypothetical protein
MATAQLYLRRFYLKVEIRRTNPYLVIATALYLACKMEECPHHIRLVAGEGRTAWPGMCSIYFYPDMLLNILHRFLQRGYVEAWGVRILPHI